MKTLADGYFRLLKFLMFLCMTGMVIMVFGNVFMRYAFNSGLPVSEELARFMFVWMTFLGAIVALHEHGHLGVDSLLKRLPPLGKRLVLALGHVLMLWVCWLITTGSYDQAVINLHVVSPALEMSMALFYGVGVVFGVSAMVILVCELYQLLFGKLSDRELVMVKSSEGIDEAERIQHEQEHAQQLRAAGTPGAKS